MKDKIHFFTEEPAVNIKFSKLKIRNLAKIIFSDHQKQVDFINIVFCTDEYLLQINLSALSHDYYTDIITFDYDESKVQSDIFISTERVLDNANQLKLTPQVELNRVLIHGFLHLCGFKDKTKKEQKEIRSLENHYLESLQDMSSK